MRTVNIWVGGTPMGREKVWAYPKGLPLGDFWVPTYPCRVSGTNDAGGNVMETFSVVRFGLQCKDGKTVKVVGLADHQRHVIKAWIPTYKVHSADTPENGAWQVYDNFLIHDGRDNDDDDVVASIGCIEIRGVRGFSRFNDVILSLAGAKASSRNDQLAEIGRSGNLIITYEQASRHPVERV